MPNALHEQLKRCVTRGRVLTSPAQLAGYDADGLGYKTFRPDAVVIPADAEELVRLLQHARQWDVPVCMRGAGTSLSGGPVAAQGGVVVHTSALRGIREICPAGFWCEVECGVGLNQLDAALAPLGLFYPPDPSSGPVCTLGGNVAMNAGGAHCFRYGVTSNYVLGVEAVLSDGSVHRFGGPAGGRGPWRYDWKRLMVGSEGTLAAFTRFWLRLLPRPEKVWTFRATYPDLVSAERAIHALVAHPSFPVAIELMDPRCVAMVENSPMAAGLPKDSFMILTEIDGPQPLVDARVESVAQLLRDAGSDDVEYSDDSVQRQKLWKARKAAGGLMGQISADFLVQDAVIPKSALAELLQLVYDEADAAGLPTVNVFHAGDGNLHPNFLFDSRKSGQLEQVEQISKRLMQRVVEVGGTLSGEHGIGNDKTAYMPLVFGPDALRLQLAVPAVFSPDHQMNPLKVFAQRRFTGRDAGTPARNAQAAPHVSPTTNGAGDDPRCFTPFLDPIDGVLCIPAEADAEAIRAQAQPHGLRFPFLIDAHRSLAEQFASSGYAPASSRFGPVCDNVLGMNWRLPNGRLIRIGERVVKTTTGYDLFRFLLHSPGPFGRPADYVVRLRRDSGRTMVCRVRGETARLTPAACALLNDCWIHWFDSVDLVFDEEAVSLRVVINSPAVEWPIVEGVLATLAKRHEAVLQVDELSASPVDGCPDLVFKTTSEHVVPLAESVAQEGRLRCVASCAAGVLHIYLEETDDLVKDSRLRSLIERHETAVHQVGGDWHSRHVPSPAYSPLESEWEMVLQREFNRA